MATKVKSEVKPEGEVEEKEKNHMFEASRKVLLAAVGAVALAQDEAEDFINKLIERGEIAEKDGRKLIHEMADKRKKRTKEAEDEVSKRVHEALDRLNVPTKGDIETLGDKIAALAKKIDELKKSQA